MPTKQTNLIFYSTDANNKKVKNTISYVNPEISNQTALELTQQVANLTTDTYQSTDRVDTQTITQKTPITVTSISVANSTVTVENGVANFTLTTAQLNSYSAFSVVVGGVFVSSMNQMPVWSSTTSEMRQYNWSASGTGTGNNNRLTVTIYLTEGSIAQTGTGRLTIPESEAYGELNLDLNFTITEAA